MRQFVRNIETTEFDGGCLVLDFINTVKSRKEHPTQEYLLGPYEWLIWTKRQKLVPGKTLNELEKLIKKKDLLKSFKKIINLREEFYQVFKAIARNERPPKESEKHLNKSIAFCHSHMSIKIVGNERPREEFEIKNDPLLLPLLKVIKSAYDLLQTGDLDRIKECDNCGWLFLDYSKNKSRRWCSMQTCGSSDKTKRYYRKMKSKSVNK